MPTWYRRDADGTITLAVHAQPGARRTGIAGLHGDALRIRVAAPPLEDKANHALVEFIAAALGVPRRNVSLVSGDRSREKRFVIVGVEGDVEAMLTW